MSGVDKQEPMFVTLPQLALRGKLGVSGPTSSSVFCNSTMIGAKEMSSEMSTAAYRRLIFRSQACFEQMDSKTYLHNLRVF